MEKEINLLINNIMEQLKCNRIKEKYNYGNYVIKITSNNNEIYNALLNILKTHFTKQNNISNDNKDTLFSYNILCDDFLYEELSKLYSLKNYKQNVVLSYCSTEKGTMRAEKVVIDGNENYILRTTKTNTFFIAMENNKQYFFVTNSKYLNKITTSKDNYLFFEHILSKLIIDDGYVLIHASAVQTKNGIILFSGEKRSGKTTLFIEIIKKFHATPVSVDKVFCKINSNGDIDVLGFPTRIRVLAGTLSKYEDCLELIPINYQNASQDELWEGKSDSKIDLSLLEFEKFIGGKFVSGGKLQSIIFPNINKNNYIYKVEKALDYDILRILHKVVYSPINPEEDFWSNIGKNNVYNHNLISNRLIDYILQYYVSIVVTASDDLESCIKILQNKFDLI